VRTLCRGIVVSSVFCGLFAGCGGGQATETVPFKTTDVSQFDKMKEDMTRNLLKRSGKKLPSPPANGKAADK
jgi:hypothetical protein